jgi:hypothetical protein
MDEPTQITIGNERFNVSPGFLETLDEIGFVIRTNSRAEVLQQAVALLYLLSRERHEKQVQTFMHYPNGGMRMLQFWKTAARPTLQAVGSAVPSAPVNPKELDPAFEKYRQAMPDFIQKREDDRVYPQEITAEMLARIPSNDAHFG